MTNHQIFKDPGHMILLYDITNFYGKAAGPHRFATEIRQKGWKVDIISQILSFSMIEIKNIILNKIQDDTKFVGFSTTFMHNKRRQDGDVYKGQTIIGLSREETDELVQFIRSLDIKVLIGGAFVGESDIDGAIVLKGQVEQRIDLDFDFTKSTIEWHDEDFITPEEFLPIEIARGCVFKCNFCDYDLNGKKLWDFVKNPELVKKELIHNYKKFGTTGYFFCDDCYNDSPKKIEAMRDVLVTLPFKLNFIAFSRIDLVMANPTSLDQMVESGLRYVLFGVESLNHKSRKAIGKGTHPDKVKQTLLDIKRKHPDLIVSCALILGLPHETLESHKETVEWFRKNKINFKTQALAIVGESNFAKNPEKYGYTLGEDGYWSNDIWDKDEVENILQDIQYTKNGFVHGIAGYSKLRNLKYTHEDILEYNKTGTFDGLTVRQTDDLIRSKISTLVNDYKKYIMKDII